MNKAIVIGDDNVNTLGVIWSFSEKHLKVNLIIMGTNNRLAVTKSKFVDKYWICDGEDELIKTLHSNFNNEIEKPVIIPTTDQTTLIIDNNFDSLKQKYIIPSINNIKGNIEKYMDKYNQFELAKNHKVKMAKTTIIDLNKNKTVSFPCILKPIISASGKKEDIKICNNDSEYQKAKKELINLKYDKILCQDFLSYSYEIDISGFSFNGDTSIPGYIKKERIWPQNRGSTTFGTVKNPKDMENVIVGISRIMKDINYNGIFDIDIFVIKEDKKELFYLNEINFRNGAISYAYGSSLISYYWYLSNIKKHMTTAPIINDDYYFINEQADLHNLFEKNISLIKYIRDLIRSKIKINFNFKDLKTCFYTIKYKIFRK